MDMLIGRLQGNFNAMFNLNVLRKTTILFIPMKYFGVFVLKTELTF